MTREDWMSMARGAIYMSVFIIVIHSTFNAAGYAWHTGKIMAFKRAEERGNL